MNNSPINSTINSTSVVELADASSLNINKQIRPTLILSSYFGYLTF